MGNIRNQLLQIFPFFCDMIPVLLHDFIQSFHTIVDFIKQTFLLLSLFRQYLFFGHHLIQQFTKLIRK